MSPNSLGEKIRLEREKKKISLREFARRIDISASYLVDIEKNRRTPSEEILEKIADLAGIPISSFAEFSPEIPKPVRDWIESHPLVARVLTILKKTPLPEKMLAYLDKSLTLPMTYRIPIAIYESELQAIGLESSTWNTETGGDLFGIWGDIPVIYLATRSGPNTIRNHAHFRLDVNYLIKLSAELESDWGLRYFGDWHSHHHLGLDVPSSEDQARLERISVKNNFNEMAEFIVTFPKSHSADQKIYIHPYAYVDFSFHDPNRAVLIVLQGLSPVREALLADSLLPEQQLASFSSFPLSRIIIPKELFARVPGGEGDVVEQISGKALARASTELEKMSSGNVEVHQTSFGHILVVPVNGDENVAFAIDRKWPHRILQVDWMDRAHGKSEELQMEIGSLSLANITALKDIFLKAKELGK
ncbi:MAG: helix-turn-helix domain-containing protein [Candidatus Hodarchaeota archaeon]